MKTFPLAPPAPTALTIRFATDEDERAVVRLVFDPEAIPEHPGALLEAPRRRWPWQSGRDPFAE